MQIYLNPAAAVEDRVNDLLAQMTLKEKIAQLGSMFITPLLENGKFSLTKVSRALELGIGHISAPAMSSALPVKELGTLLNEIQHYLIEKTRLGIPAIMHEECLNGFRARGATIFPQNIGLASTWQPELVGQITALIRRQMRAAGIHQGLAPVLDVARDPRWGRVEETFGEDPCLVSRMGVAYIKGLQGDDIRKGVIATVKHFAGHGLPESGLNCAPAHIPPRLLRDVYLVPFEKAVKETGVLSLMHAYHEIDGIPCAASEELLTGILRREWGFTGVVVSDYFAIDQLMTIHRVASQKGEAAGLALKAGVDVELPFTHCFGEPLLRAVETGAVSVSLLDTAVSRVLALKFKLGLFEEAYVDPEATALVLDTEENRQLALQAARRSIVLLKNLENILPLNKNAGTIAVIGPNADDQRNLLGDYTFPAHAAHETKKDEDTGSEVIVWRDKNGESGQVAEPRVISILEGIKTAVGAGTQVVYARGCGINDSQKSGFAEAVKVARSASVAVVVVGDKSGLMPDNTSGEMRDRCVLKLPGVQEELVKIICETGTPVVLVLVCGRPVVLSGIEAGVKAIVAAWLPGEEGGRAIADVLFGDYNPGGKLPVTFPETEGQIPLYASHKPSGRKSGIWTDYVEGQAVPRYEFGFGLSYTQFEFDNLIIQPLKISRDGVCRFSLDIRNTGQREGEEVVQLYINDVVASVTRPIKELKDFQRVCLKPGEGKTLHFDLAARQLAFHNREMQKQTETGIYRVMIGSSSEQIRLEGEFEVTN